MTQQLLGVSVAYRKLACVFAAQCGNSPHKEKEKVVDFRRNSTLNIVYHIREEVEG